MKKASLKLFAINIIRGFYYRLKSGSVIISFPTILSVRQAKIVELLGFHYFEYWVSAEDKDIGVIQYSKD
tara:strand:- start:3199 stop:3408 length:210 start_codon:yes stop_codon:yes gene_type:complete